MNVELVVDAKSELGEGPVWDERSQSLFWVDIENGHLHSYQVAGDANRVWEVGCKIGAAVVRDGGGMVLATADGFELFDLKSSEKTPIADPENDRPNNRFNDGKCDPQGRFWAGTMSMLGEHKAGSLYVLDQDQSVRHIVDGVTTSNGLGWSPDQSSMYYIDTPTMMARAYRFDGQSGTISDERVAVEIPDGVGRPDGMTVDADGMLWIAHWDGGRVTRWDPVKGRLLETVPVPADRVTSCAFGGTNLDTLFITTARHGLSAEKRAAQPHAGGLFAIQPGVGGMAASRYAG